MNINQRWRHGAWWRWLAAVALAVQLGLLGCPPDSQAGPSAATPAGFLLPWACGQGYRLTWGPEGHWAAAKATGLAYDFGLPVGIPLYAPTDGVAYFLQDDRALDTNLGHYVEIVDSSGQWLVRLAHLRDLQRGARPVSAGDLIGYSGVSGASAAHLHLELMMRNGDRWVAPDPDTLSGLYGLPISAFVEGAILSNGDCGDRLTLEGPVVAAAPEITLGQSVALRVPLHNPGAEPVHVHMVQLSMVRSDGTAQVAEARGPWTLPPRETTPVTMQAWPGQEGDWQVGAVSYETDDATPRIAADGEFRVAASTLHLIGVSLGQDHGLAIGERPRFEVWLQNEGTDALETDDLILSGRRPDGGTWRTALGREWALAPGAVRVVRMGADLPVQQVGNWSVEQVSYRRGDNTFAFARPDDAFTVDGPELAAEDLAVTVDSEGLHIGLTLRNAGTEAADPREIEVWGWRPGGEAPFDARQVLTDPLAPGDVAALDFEVPTEGDAGLWRVVAAGYWRDGDYYTVPLPQQPAVDVAAWSNSDDDAASAAPPSEPVGIAEETSTP